MNKIILSLGSSLGNRREILQSAISAIEEKIGKIDKISSFYETEPWGFNDEHFFINAAVSLFSDIDANELLNVIQHIEAEHGRKRNGIGYEARTLDIDIIFYGNKIHYEKNLSIPHPLAHKRKFVLMPIAEIEPDFVHPVLNVKIANLLQLCQDQSFLKVIE